EGAVLDAVPGGDGVGEAGAGVAVAGPEREPGSPGADGDRLRGGRAEAVAGEVDGADELPAAGGVGESEQAPVPTGRVADADEGVGPAPFGAQGRDGCGRAAPGDAVDLDGEDRGGEGPARVVGGHAGGREGLAGGDAQRQAHVAD